MTFRHLKIASLPTQVIPLRIAWRKPVFIIPLATLAVFAALGIINLLTADNPSERWLEASSCATLLAIIWVFSAVTRIPAPWSVRFSTRAGRLRLASSADRYWAPYIFLILAGFVWPLIRLLNGQGTSLIWRIRAITLACVAVAGIVDTLRTQFRSPGLTLTPERIYGVRGGVRVDIAWNDLYRLDVAVIRKRARGTRRTIPRSKPGHWLYLTRFGHPELAVNTLLTGTDVNVLYWTVMFFWEHPEERELLRDPASALRRVEDFYGERTQAAGQELPDSSAV